jgi:hypothetical protein
MSKTRQTIGISAFVMLVGFGTGWALDEISGNSPAQSGAAIERVNKNNAVTAPVSRESLGTPPAATDSSQEYDRSDLILSQG